MTNPNPTPFPCVNCGACCESVGRIPALRKAGYPESDTSDRCRFLRYVPPATRSSDPNTPSRLSGLAKALANAYPPPEPDWPSHLSPGDSYCSIYPNRPPYCRVNGPLRPPSRTDSEWYSANLEKCKELAMRCPSTPDSKLIAIDLALSNLNPESPTPSNIIPIDSASRRPKPQPR